MTRLLPNRFALAAIFAALPLQAEETDSKPPPSPPTHIQITPPRGPVFVQPGEIDQQGVVQEMPEDPYWRETVDRAVSQFESENPELRRSAVMLLGKYPVPPARNVVEKALEDPDASVRQTALVSVLEEQGQVNPQFSNKIFQLVRDPDVSIRRIASHSIRSLIYSFPLSIQPGTVQMQRQLSPEAQRILQEAFRDEDVSVRRNMVSNYPFLQISLPEETVVELLHDPDQQVAVHALRWGLSQLTPATLAREAKALAVHESPIFRLELAQALQSHRSPEILETLNILQKDPHPPVAIEAMLAVFNRQQNIALYERMIKLYRQSGRPSDTGQRILFAAQMLGDDGKPFLREWMDENDPAIRQHAARIYLNRFGLEVDRDFLLSLLNDSVPGIRQQAMRTLMQVNERPSDEEVRRMMSNRHSDVRQAAANLASLLPVDRAEDLLLDLLLDEVREVRLAALQQIGMRQIPGWEEIMSISLQINDPLTQRHALDWLIRNPSPKTLDLLRAFRNENPQSPLRPQIEPHLRRYQPTDPS